MGVLLMNYTTPFTENNLRNLRVDLIATPNVRLVLPLIEQKLKETVSECTFGDATYEAVVQGMEAGALQLWLVTDKTGNIEMTAVTRVAVYPSGKRVFVIEIICGRRLNACVEFLDHVDGFIASYGCTEIESRVKPGISRMLEKHGFHRVYEVIRRPVRRGLN